MAKAAAGGFPQKKKKEAGYGFKFPEVRNAAVERGDVVSSTRKHYVENVVPAMVEEFGYKNPLTVPRVEKIVLNIGLGEAIKQPKLLEQAFEALGNISG